MMIFFHLLFFSDMNSQLSLMPLLLFCLIVLALLCPCFGQNGPPAKVIFNEIFIDEPGGDLSFIEIRRTNSDTVMDLQNIHIAILNSDRKGGFHLEVKAIIKVKKQFHNHANNHIFFFQVRGIFSFKEKQLAIGQNIAYIGKENEHPGTNIGHFGDDSMVYAKAMHPGKILEIRQDGYLVMMLFESQLKFEGNIQRKDTEAILNGFFDALFVGGPNIRPKCHKLYELVNLKISSNLMHIMQDITGTEVSLSNCLGDQATFPFWSKQWRITDRSPGRENVCPGREQPNMDVAIAKISEPSVPHDISDDCNAVSTAAFSKKRKLDEILVESSSGPSCPVQLDGEMADIEVREEANDAVVKRLRGDVETNPPWCPKDNFDTAWIQHIKSHQSKLLPLAGEHNALSFHVDQMNHLNKISFNLFKTIYT